MRLTDHTDYSLRVLMYLNRCKRVTTLNELQRELRVSRNNLIQVSHRLAKCGFIETARGRSGGLRIAAHAGRITLKDIVCQTEETFSMAQCFGNKAHNCTFLKNCGLKRSLADALGAFLEALALKTLDDVTPRGEFNGTNQAGLRAEG